MITLDLSELSSLLSSSSRTSSRSATRHQRSSSDVHRHLRKSSLKGLGPLLSKVEEADKSVLENPQVVADFKKLESFLLREGGHGNLADAHASDSHSSNGDDTEDWDAELEAEESLRVKTKPDKDISSHSTIPSSSRHSRALSSSVVITGLDSARSQRSNASDLNSARERSKRDLLAAASLDASLSKHISPKSTVSPASSRTATSGHRRRESARLAPNEPSPLPSPSTSRMGSESLSEAASDSLSIYSESPRSPISVGSSVSTTDAIMVKVLTDKLTECLAKMDALPSKANRSYEALTEELAELKSMITSDAKRKKMADRIEKSEETRLAPEPSPKASPKTAEPSPKAETNINIESQVQEAVQRQLRLLEKRFNLQQETFEEQLKKRDAEIEKLRAELSKAATPGISVTVEPMSTTTIPSPKPLTDLNVTQTDTPTHDTAPTPRAHRRTISLNWPTL